MVIEDKGIFYVKKHGSNTGHWALYYQYFQNNERFQKKVEKMTFPEFGFRDDMTLDEAKARAKQLNAERKINKDKIRKSAERVVELRLLDKTLFPEDQVKKFIEKITDENAGSNEHLKKLFSHFNFVQKMVIDLRLTSPSQYSDEAKYIYKYFMTKKISANYAACIVSLLNRWGKFVAKHQGSFFEEVPVAKGRFKSAISECQRTKVGKSSEMGVRTVSAPLTPAILGKMKDKISVENYHWLYLSVWLGLRPEEVDCLHKTDCYKVRKDIGEVIVISVYQSKLMNLPEEQRWKHIPLVMPQQQYCVEILEKSDFKRPLPKIVRKYSGNNRITLYGGRKNFVDLCLDEGQDFTDISAWMGHKNTSITFKVYKQRQMVRYTKSEDVKRRAGFKIT